jgi:hypothetical protein
VSQKHQNFTEPLSRQNPVVPDDDLGRLPTDDECDDAVRRAGFTHCFDKPYWWTIKDATPVRAPSLTWPTVNPIVSRAKKRKDIGKWPK